MWGGAAARMGDLYIHTRTHIRLPCEHKPDAHVQYEAESVGNVAFAPAHACTHVRDTRARTHTHTGRGRGRNGNVAGGSVVGPLRVLGDSILHILHTQMYAHVRNEACAHTRRMKLKARETWRAAV